MEDLWIRARLAETAVLAESCLRDYRFHDYARALYSFVWNDFCDWYIEIIKPRLMDEKDADARGTLRVVFAAILRLLHPACPFITEELWQRFGFKPERSISCAPWPGEKAHAWEQPKQEIELLKSVVTAVRNLRAEYRVSEADEVAVQVKAPAAAVESLRRQQGGILRLAKASSFTVGTDLARVPLSAVAHLAGDVEVILPLEGHIDLAAERDRLRKEIEKVEGQVAGIDRKLGNADFMARAKPEVVEGERGRRAEAVTLLDRLRASLAALG